jgi:hypothetical protein
LESQGEEVAAVQSDEALAITREAPTSATPDESCRLVISISQTADEDSDIANLHKLIDILNDFPGQDEVRLHVTNGSKVVDLKLSNISTNYCPELHQRLVEIVGEGGLKLEAIDNT